MRTDLKRKMSRLENKGVPKKHEKVIYGVIVATGFDVTSHGYDMQAIRLIFNFLITPSYKFCVSFSQMKEVSYPFISMAT